MWIAIVSNLVRGISFVAYSATNFTKSDNTTSISFDNFGELISGKTVNGFSLAVTTANATPWDLYVENGVAITQLVSYSTQGIVLPLTAVNIRAVNPCTTPDQSYGAGTRPIPAISGSFNPSFTMAGPHYVVGSAAVGEGVLLSNVGPCPGLEINDDGVPVNNPATNSLRFDIKITPGVAAIIQPGLYRLDMTITLADDATGTPVKSDFYSLVIEIKSLLSLQAVFPSQIDFNFTEIKNYTNGVTSYGSTKLNVNSNVNWDLIAVGTSTRNEGSSGGSPYWDNSVSYSTLGTVDIPLDVLELFQSPGNPTAGQSGLGLDYSIPFTSPPSGNNNIEVAYGAGAGITGVGFYAALGKTIAGNWGATGAGNMMTPGSYLAINGAWNRANFSFIISYRLLPGLPVIFSHTNMGAMPNYARPGAYTMQVKYLLIEDQ